MLLGPPPPGAEVHRFDFGDAPELDAETKAHQQRRASFLHGAHERDLAEFRIGEDVLVVAEARGGLPEAVADLDHLIVLGVHHVFRQRQPLGIVRDDGGQILVDDAFETGAIAVERNGSGGRIHARSEAAGEDGSRHHGEGCEG